MADKCISDTIKLLSEYHNIQRFIDLKKAEIKWNNKLNGLKVHNSFYNQYFNLLTLTICKIASKDLNNSIYIDAILYNLNNYLAILEGYDENIIKNFSDKLINIEGKHLFSTLTELAIANYYKQNNFEVEFFYKYSLKYKDGSIKQKDFDLLLNDGKNIFIVEVYMPTFTPDETKAFFGDYDIEIEELKDHISEKINRKFDLNNSPKILDIKYPLILAINTHYDSMLQSQIYIPFKIKSLYKKIEIMLTNFPILYGIMLIETDFTKKDAKLYLHKILWNPRVSNKLIC